MDFFIVGTSRTGSTLIRNILDEHRDVGVLNETHWVPTMLERFGRSEAPVEELLEVVVGTHWDTGCRVVDVTLERTGRSWSDVSDAVKERLGDVSGVGAFQEALFDAVFNVGRGDLRRGDKTPDYGFYMASLQELWPNARFVHIAREGVGATRSMLRHPGCRKMVSAGYDNWVPLSFGAHYARLTDARPSFKEMLRSWRRRMDQIRREARLLQPGTFEEVWYEDLLARPESVVRRIAEFLELQVDEGWLERSASRIRPGRVVEGLSAAEMKGLGEDDLAALGFATDPGGTRVVTRKGETLVQIDRNELPRNRGGTYVFSCVRDEMLRLPYFLEYYRSLGVERFFVLDNCSTDGTREYLFAQPDVHVFSATGSYSDSAFGIHWINALLGRFGVGGWVLVVDADEILVYPDSETMRLPELLTYLEGSGVDGLLTFLLDMYGPERLSDVCYRRGTPFLEATPCFDSDSYTFGPHGNSVQIPLRGGIRRRLFWDANDEEDARPPFLPKIPLVRWRKGMAYRVSTHILDGVLLASTTGALLHFKFLPDFEHRARSEAARGEHWDNGAQYAVYASALREQPNIDPQYEGTVRYRNSEQLVKLRLMHRGEELLD